MYVMALRQFAVFMNAGSYVIIPKSSGAALIWRRSIARIVPSVIGTSYFFPVRLSVIVSVSVVAIVVLIRFGWHLVIAVDPSREILKLAAFAAERAPRGIDRLLAAEHAARVGHSAHCTAERYPSAAW